jgi:hypothetical protein
MGRGVAFPQGGLEWRVFVYMYIIRIDYHPLMTIDVMEIDAILLLCLVSLVNLSGR